MTNVKLNFFKKSITQRSVLNVGFNNGVDQRFINFIKCAEQWGPSGNGPLTDGTTQWTQIIGSNGYPNVRLLEADGKFFGGGVRLASSRFYGGSGSGQYYVLRWKGDGVVRLSMNYGTLTHVSGMSSNVTFTSPDKWSTTSGADSYAVFQYDGPSQLISLIVRATDRNNVGAFLNSLELYRLDDEADRNAGKLFRRTYTQAIADLCPSALRFMDWHGGNDVHMVRFDHRQVPTCEGWAGSSNWNAGPRYGKTSGVNQFTLAAQSGTPASRIHGEIAIFQLGSGVARAGAYSVSAITNAANGRVTCAGHPFNTGDQISIYMPQITKTGIVASGSAVMTGTNNTNLATGSEVFSPLFPVGTKVVSSTATTITMSAVATGSSTAASVQFVAMSELNQRPMTITVIDANTFDSNIDTSAVGSFAGTGTAEQFVTLKMDNDPTAYPITYASGFGLAGHYGNAYYAAGHYKHVVFDKTYAAQKDASGNWVYGAWVGTNEQGHYTLNSGVPLEVCVALVNEVNALSPAQPVHAWFNVPVMGMCSADPDYDAAQNYGVKMTDVILNGASGMPGLLSSLDYYIELSNETWNQAGNAWSQCPYGKIKSWQRWPQTGMQDLNSWSTLKSSLVMDDIKQANASSRIKTVLAGQGSQGATNNSINDLRIDGTTFYTNDILVTGNPRLNGKKPIQYPHDYFAFAGYMDPNNGTANYETTTLATYVTNWVAAVGDPVAQEAACASMVNDMLNGTNSAGGETMYRYTNQILPQFSAKLAPYRKTVIMYEGGWDHDVAPIVAAGFGTAGSWFALGGFTAGNPTITGINTTYVAALAVGNWIKGHGIPADARIISKTTSSITLDKNVSITATFGEFIAFDNKNAYLLAVKNSTAWKNGYLAWFNAFDGTVNAGMPSDYVAISIRWGHFWFASYGFTNTEYTGGTQLWYAEGARNRALPN